MDNHKALEDAVLAIKYADTPVKVGSFQGFDLSVTVNSNMIVLKLPSTTSTAESRERRITSQSSGLTTQKRRRS